MDISTSTIKMYFEKKLRTMEFIYRTAREPLTFPREHAIEGLICALCSICVRSLFPPSTLPR